MNYRIMMSVMLVGAVMLMPDPAHAQRGPHADRPQAQSSRAQADRGQMDRGRAVDRDRQQDRDRTDEGNLDRDRLRDQDRTGAPDFSRLSDDDIYGRELMSGEERNAYRRQLQEAATPEARRRIEEQHRNTILERAQARGVKVAPPGQGIYGGALMSVEERSRFREQLRSIGSAEERRAFLAQHRVSMQERATARGVPFEQLEETEEAE